MNRAISVARRDSSTSRAAAYLSCGLWLGWVGQGLVWCRVVVVVGFVSKLCWVSASVRLVRSWVVGGVGGESQGSRQDIVQIQHSGAAGIWCSMVQHNRESTMASCACSYTHPRNSSTIASALNPPLATKHSSRKPRACSDHPRSSRTAASTASRGALVARLLTGTSA
jgi:hypothetical protein